MISRNDPDTAVVSALRRQRRRRRVADLEWFEVIYRVYLVALGGGGFALWLSSYARDSRLDESAVLDAQQHGPAIVGCVVALAFAVGARSGSQGGPIAIEEADVRHLLLAPVSRSAVLRGPAWQRLRSAAFAGAMGGALAGQLAGRRLTGSIYSWALSGAAVGASAGLIYVGVALVIHIARWKPWQATAVASIALGSQGAAVTDLLPGGPFDVFGSIGLWPLRVRPLDLIGPVIALVVALAGWLRVDKLSIEQLARRSSLVSQLRFAATMQDLRTVILLRRQLGLEHARARPWLTLPRRGLSGITMRRGLQSLLRFPGRRLGRIAVLGLAAAFLSVIALRGWTPSIILAGLCWFLVGLEAIEPYSQELDHMDRTELLPVEVGLLHQRLLRPSALVIGVLGLLGGLIGGAMEGTRSDIGISIVAGLLIGPPAALFGGLGAVLNTGTGIPSGDSTLKNGGLMPPEVAGISTMFSVAFPPAVAVVGSMPVLLVRETMSGGGHPLSTALRCTIALTVVLIISGWWIRVRPAFRTWWARSQEEAANHRRRRQAGETT